MGKNNIDRDDIETRIIESIKKISDNEILFKILAFIEFLTKSNN